MELGCLTQGMVCVTAMRARCCICMSGTSNKVVDLLCMLVGPLDDDDDYDVHMFCFVICCTHQSDVCKIYE